jgi:hypothetical protein
MDKEAVRSEENCDLNHNLAVWQGYGLFGFQLQPECPPRGRPLLSQRDKPSAVPKSFATTGE